jgi:hypothetical protein
VGIGFRSARSVFIERLERPGQQQHWNPLGVGIGLDRFADLVPAHSRHRHIRQHQIRMKLTRLGDRFQTVIHRKDPDVLAR